MKLKQDNLCFLQTKINLYMASLYRTAHVGENPLKNSNSTLGIKNVNLRHRNYSNSRLNQQSPIDSLFVKQSIDDKRRKDEANSNNNSKQFKKYCLNKLKVSSGTEKFNVIRKNRSLKVMGKNQSNKHFNHTKVEPLSTEQIFLDRREGNVAENAMLISIKRRVELIKSNQNKRKLTIKDKESQKVKEQPRSDVSFQQKMDFCYPQLQKIGMTNKIQSQNVLGEGLKKCSSSKIKILVKNPFEKLMRLEESRQNRKQINPIESSIELQQSQIINKMDQTNSTFSNRCELEEMLALI